MVGAGHHDHCITGGVMSKFGIMDNEAVEVYQFAEDLGFTPVGMHSHIGSGILDPEPFKLAIESTIDIAGKVHNEAGIDFEFVDFGGGVGIPCKCAFNSCKQCKTKLQKILRCRFRIPYFT